MRRQRHVGETHTGVDCEKGNGMLLIRGLIGSLFQLTIIASLIIVPAGLAAGEWGWLRGWQFVGCYAVMLISATIALAIYAPASLEARRDTLYVDMQLHETVITRCNVAGATVSVADQEVFPDFGLVQLFNTVARHISNLLIDSARYDPLHSSRSEQQIFDQAHDWLTHLRWEPELSATLETRQGELPFILRNEAIRGLVHERLALASERILGAGEIAGL